MCVLRVWKMIRCMMLREGDRSGRRNLIYEMFWSSSGSEAWSCEDSIGSCGTGAEREGAEFIFSRLGFIDWQPVRWGKYK